VRKERQLWIEIAHLRSLETGDNSNYEMFIAITSIFIKKKVTYRRTYTEVNLVVLSVISVAYSVISVSSGDSMPGGA
jgi:hypothetical protein